jgi:hypothetical protein
VTGRASVSRRTAAALGAVVVLAAGCGSDDGPSDDLASLPEPTRAVQGPVAATPATEGCTGAPAVGPAPAGSTTDLDTKPVVPAGPKSVTALQVADVVVGTGAPACSGASLTVRYVGALADGGRQFDASWDRGKDSTFPFTLGAGDVIPGWDRGLVGMREGGRRQLTIPAEQGYGASGYPPDIPGGATLVFVVDLVKVEPAAGG